MLKLRAVGTDICVSYPFIAVFTILSFTDKSEYFTASLSAVLLHELGHIAAMKIMSVHIEIIRFKLGAINIVADCFGSKKQSAAIALAGPIVNLSLSVLYFVCDGFLHIFGAVNLVVGVFNLLPISGLDGNDISYYLLSHVFGRAGELTARILSTAVLFVAAAVCAALFFYVKPNISLVFAVIYLIILTIFKL